MDRPCPPNGLARSAWFHERAAEVEETDPHQAAYCRATASAIERRVFAGMPLVAMMEGRHS
jgi:hypothetical protein